MDFKTLFEDDRAVSPVIGVILMVAITVILAAVIGTFVLGLGDQVSSTTPQASFGFTQENVTFGGVEAEAVTITHESGEQLEETNIDIRVAGNNAFDVQSNSTSESWGGNGDISAGTETRVIGYSSNDTLDGINLNEASDFGLEWDESGNGEFDTANVPADETWDTIRSGDEIRVVFDNPDNDQSSTLGTFQVN